MAVTNRTVDEIHKLEAQKKAARTFGDYVNLADRVFRLKRQFMSELAQVRRLAPPPTILS